MSNFLFFFRIKGLITYDQCLPYVYIVYHICAYFAYFTYISVLTLKKNIFFLLYTYYKKVIMMVVFIET